MTNFDILQSDSTNEKKEELLSMSFVNKLKTSLREKLDPSEDPEQADQMNALIEMKIRHLETMYPDHKSYQTYYILKNKVIPESVTVVDFPGDDSVIAFIENF